MGQFSSGVDALNMFWKNQKQTAVPVDKPEKYQKLPSSVEVST